MSLPRRLQETFSPEEVQFIVENQKIKIFPRITTSKRRSGNGSHSSNSDDDMSRWRMLTMDGHELENMIVMKSTEVTLWLALLLKQQSKCNIIIPEWLTVKGLDLMLQYEKRNIQRFSALPWDWLVVSEILFKQAADDFNDPIYELRNRIQDLKEIRQMKVLQGLKNLNESHMQLDNLGLLEINELRPFIVEVMDKLRQIHASVLDTTETEPQDYDDDKDIGMGTSISSNRDTSSSGLPNAMSF
ncbi:similar to Saccharomyces cerevisiae YJL072C PSF2 Subunit of the GINS complex (Sld5p, Psf1p, Psf2p, Psf3p) [Maudiozyma barnettii]|uniref:DNA replication complex GINS protein PSF2 n=1 Tax=Maudiozyma barnettii TaxID=61262 RepID=A0A8H2VKF4_9SACH|nr:DNA replication protein PSF2 [Kazachstania barnettii]CAB4256935.1 similar to Saccharomyces cerevisiae YJL072C PSF2 Subunit of the GINS complex [Kazachstania barnettii]CAD1785540.1 similar to Saccharomyces cerevisiae YJL072C PSF2 Subunit of the GINS complex (Sld5p, Psf1p, Psf2p, Psf3p) [Kazachstania barnettii]